MASGPWVTPAIPDVEVILLDLRLPDMDGIEVLQELRRREAPAGVVLLTGHGTVDTAIQAIRLGAHDYLEKPCPIEKVEMTLRKTREHLGLLRRQRILQDGYSPADVRPGLVGASPAFEGMMRAVRRIGAADATTLILGETGVGKDLVAKLVHAESPRRDAPYVVVDCAALHEELLQSELFGHEKGAFSGAGRLKHGLFEVADGGTLFLDEVGETNPDIQASLLRVLESGRFRRLGGTREIAVDVRVISATNRNLEAAIAKRRFREDLYFRLSTLTVEVPPLRDRREDIRSTHRALHGPPEPTLRARGPAGTGGAGAARKVRLARQRARAPARPGAGHHPRRRRDHHARGAAAHRARRRPGSPGD